MTLPPDDPRFSAAGLTVAVGERSASVLDGEVELAQVAVSAGQLVFLPNRSAKQQAVLKRMDIWVE